MRAPGNARRAGLPDVAANGRPLNTADNLEEVLRRLGVTVRLNGSWFNLVFNAPGTLYLNRSLMGAQHAWIKSECARLGVPTRGFENHLLLIGAKNHHRAQGVA